METLALEMKNISKSFSGVQVLRNVHLEVKPGEVHVLLGENGAGKSTLIKILSGAYKKESGDVYLFGEKLEVKSPKDAINKGISVIYQEFNLNPFVSICDNIFLNEEFTKGIFVDKAKMVKKAKEIMDVIGLELDPRTLVKDLSVAQKQMVEIAKALSTDLKILVLDEPTAAITDKETEKLFDIVRDLKSKGYGIVYISHRMSELFEIGDRCTVMRDGEYVDTVNLSETNVDELTELMVNKKVTLEKENNPYVDENYTALKVDGLYYRNLLKDVSFDIKKGEIFGVAGLVGSGRTETAKCIIGAYSKDKGEVTCKNGTVKLKKNSIPDAIKNGIVYLSEDRKDEGLVLMHSIERNIILPNLDNFGKVLKSKSMSSFSKDYMKRLKVKAVNEKQTAQSLSGGNQQKVVIAKWVANDADVYIFDEPTRGIDIGARSEIYNIMMELVKNGASIMMISSDLVEVLKMSNRIMVMREGKVAGILDNTESLSQKDILDYAFGGKVNER